MALSFVEYTADGVDTQFTVTFSFIARTHVSVTIDGVDDPTFTFINDGLVEPTNTPANLEKVRISRATPTGATVFTDFEDGSTLVEDDLDRVLQQAMYVAEETLDAAADALQLDVADLTRWDALSKKIVDVVDPTSDQDAATKTYVDTKTAADVVAAALSATNALVSENAAATSATGAETAKTGAETAKTGAETAETNAQTAETNAQTAETNAQTAETAAVVAQAAALVSELAAVVNAAGFRFNFDSATAMADPGSGDVRFNHATLSSVTALAFDALSADAGAPDVSDFLVTWDDSTSTALRGTIVIRKIGTPATWAIFSVTGAVTDNTGWLEVAVTFVASNGSWTDADAAIVHFSRTGDKGAGDVAGPASSTDHAVARFDLTTGKVLLNSAVIVDDSGNVSGVGTVDGRDLAVDGTKLDGIASLAEVNPTPISQGDAEAGTSTTEQIFTAERVKQAIAALETGGSIDIQTITATGNWTKPSSGSLVFVEIWGAGGSGGTAQDAGGGASGGGGGGGYKSGWFEIGDLGATETVTIGAGGAARTSDNQHGIGGGDTTFGSLLTAFGGGGGAGGAGISGGGGGGGGGVGAGADTAVATGGTGGAPLGGTANNDNSGFGGGGGATGAGLTKGGNGFGGGGGGGGGGVSEANSVGGGDSVYGAGGGGGGRNTSNAGAGGVSDFAGNGGAAGSVNNDGNDGSAPGGGGGSTKGGDSGAGARGEGRISTF